MNVVSLHCVNWFASTIVIVLPAFCVLLDLVSPVVRLTMTALPPNVVWAVNVNLLALVLRAD
jgi:hypothetical protein